MEIEDSSQPLDESTIPQQEIKKKFNPQGAEDEILEQLFEMEWDQKVTQQISELKTMLSLIAPAEGIYEGKSLKVNTFPDLKEFMLIHKN